jgi:hypothetical protein
LNVSIQKKQEAQKCQKGYCQFLIFFSDTSRQTETKLGNIDLLDSLLENVGFCCLEVHKRNKRPKDVCSVFVCGPFFFQPILMDIFLYIPYKIIYCMLTDFLWLLPFPRCKEVNTQNV